MQANQYMKKKYIRFISRPTPPLSSHPSSCSLPPAPPSTKSLEVEYTGGVWWWQFFSSKQKKGDFRRGSAAPQPGPVPQRWDAQPVALSGREPRRGRPTAGPVAALVRAELRRVCAGPGRRGIGGGAVGAEMGLQKSFTVRVCPWI